MSGLTHNIEDEESGKRGQGWMLSVRVICSMILLGVPSIFKSLLQTTAALPGHVGECDLAIER